MKYKKRKEDINIYFYCSIFVDVVEVRHDEINYSLLMGLIICQSHRKNVNVRPVSAVRPSSVTDKLKGGVLYYLGLCYMVSQLHFIARDYIIAPLP